MTGEGTVIEGPRAGRAEARSDGWTAALATAVALAAVTALFLADPLLRHFAYPVGWDASYYVWRTAAVPLDGLARLGAVRSGSPLLFAVLMRATGQNAFTILSVVPPLLAGILAVAAAAMVRSALGTRPMWTPVIATLTWTAFGRVGIVNGHFDQLLNAALVVGAFAAAIAFAATGRGAVATGVMLAAAGLAEWPFWAFAAAVLLGGLATFVAVARRAGDSDHARSVGPLLAAIGASAVFVGLTFFAQPPGERLGPSLSRPSLRRLLKQRFVTRLKDPLRYVAFPLALGGGIVAAKEPSSPSRDGRRLFVSLMVAWVVVTVVAGLAQAAGIPVAGARLTSYLFAVPILAAVFVWWLARLIAERLPGGAGVAVAAAVVAAAVAGFGALAWHTGHERIPYFERDGVRQAATAGAYLDAAAPGRPVTFLVVSPKGDTSTGGRWWNVVRAALPPDVVARATRFDGKPSVFASKEPNALGMVLARYNRAGFRQALRDGSGVVVGPGVLALGNAPPRVANLRLGPYQADIRIRTMLWLVPALVALLALSGSGWSAALLPGDPVVRIALAPALGIAVLSLAALGWERLGLGFASWEALLLVGLATLAGWAAVFGLRRRAPALP